MKWLKDNIETIVAILVIIGMVIGGLSYFAKSEDLELVDMRLDQKIVNDAVYDLSREAWMLEDKYGGSDCTTWRGPDVIKDRIRYRKLLDQLETMKKRRDVIINQMGGKQ